MNVRGCFFHFAKAVYRKIQELGLTNSYKNNRQVRFYVELISILPLVPYTHLRDALTVCNSFKPINDERISRFEEYLMYTWFSEESLFKHSFWSHWENCGPRTNNNLEGFHSKLNRLLKKAHPNFFHIVSVIQSVQHENEIDLAIYNTSGRERPQTSKYLRSHQRLMGIRAEFLAGGLTLFRFMELCVGAIKLND